MPMINKNFKFIIKVIVFIILFLPYFAFQIQIIVNMIKKFVIN